MWVFFKFGMFSAVVDRSNCDAVVVRARVRSDLNVLNASVFGRAPFDVIETPEADYPYRVVMSKTQWAEALGWMAEDIDYDNFKGAVEVVQGAERANIYHRVWAVLADGFERCRPRATKKRR